MPLVIQRKLTERFYGYWLYFLIQSITDVNSEKVAYEQTKDRSLLGLENKDILWIGQGEI